MGEQGVTPSFKTFWFPFSNYLCLAFMLMIISVMLAIPGIRESVYAMPIWVGVIYVAYRLRSRNAKVAVAQ
jgi:AAT family amino acid transporter/aromatic amino acid transport protein AroP